MATNVVVTATNANTRQLHIPKLNEFATESNFQALQHNYQDNNVPYFRLISPRTHKPYFKHTCHTHKHTLLYTAAQYAQTNVHPVIH